MYTVFKFLTVITGYGLTKHLAFIAINAGAAQQIKYDLQTHGITCIKPAELINIDTKNNAQTNPGFCRKAAGGRRTA